jgi:hypothetical protein
LNIFRDFCFKFHDGLNVSDVDVTAHAIPSFNANTAPKRVRLCFDEPVATIAPAYRNALSGASSSAGFDPPAFTSPSRSCRPRNFPGRSTLGRRRRRWL